MGMEMRTRTRSRTRMEMTTNKDEEDAEEGDEVAGENEELKERGAGGRVRDGGVALRLRAP